MRTLVKIPALAFLFSSLISCGGQEEAEVAREEETLETPAVATAPALSEPHGGVGIETAAHHLEIVCLPDGIRAYRYDADGKPVSAEGMTGSVTLVYARREPQKADFVYRPAGSVGEGAQALSTRDYLHAAIDLSGDPAQSLEATFVLPGAAGEEDESVKFAAPFPGTVERPFMCPMHADVWGETAESRCALCGMATAAPRVLTM